MINLLNICFKIFWLLVIIFMLIDRLFSHTVPVEDQIFYLVMSFSWIIIFELQDIKNAIT